MLVKVLGYILTHLFSFIFKTSQETAQTARDDLVSVFSAISKIGASRIKEFLATIPIFIEFLIHLIKEGEKLEKSRQLILIGAAAVLSTLVGFLIVSVLGSWTVQTALAISIPLIGVPLVFATGLAITTIVVLFIWLVMFVLNKALADDPEYMVIRDRYLSVPAKQCLSDIERQVDKSHRDRPVENLVPFNPDYLYQLIELKLLAQGEKADVAKIASRLEKIKDKITEESSQREIFVKMADKLDQMSNVTITHVPIQKERNNMAMITCPDCNGKLSDLAPVCPHCGRPNTRLDLKHRNVGFLLGTGVFLIPMIFSWFTLRKGHTTTARVVSFAWLALIMMIVLGTDTSTPIQSSSPIPASQTTRGFVGSTTAADVARAYEANTLAADQRFKGKKYIISGTVADVNTNYWGDPYVTLEGGVNMFMEPQFAFPKSAFKQLAALSKGVQVSLLCTGQGDIAKTPMWDSCSL